jgi:RNA-binding protein
MESHQKLKDKARSIEPIIRIGKNGLSEGQINEIKKLIKKRKLIKVKMLDSFMEGKDRAEVAQEMAQKSETTLIQLIGNIVVLYQE